jgi:hypothetical protein
MTCHTVTRISVGADFSSEGLFGLGLERAMKPEMITEANLQKAVQEAVISAKKEALSEMVQKVRLGLGLNGVKGEAQRAIDKLLEQLAADPVTEVRQAAKKSPSTLGEVTWWSGKFSSDPLSRLDASEAEALKPLLESISAICDTPYHYKDNAPRLIALVERLPDHLLIDIAERCLSRFEVVIYQTLDPLGALFLSKPGAREVLLLLVERWVQHESGGLCGGGTLARMLALLPEPERFALCCQLLGTLQNPPQLRLGFYGKDPIELLAAAIALAWPPTRDVQLVLDALLAMPKSDEDDTSRGRFELSAIFRREDIEISHLAERLLEAFFAGLVPGRTCVLRGSSSSLGSPWRCSGPQPSERFRANERRSPAGECRSSLGQCIIQSEIHLQ